MCWISVNSAQELFEKYPNHLGSTVARWLALQEIPLLARKFHTALTLLRKERRKEGGNVAVCSVFMEYLWEFGFIRANLLCRTILHAGQNTANFINRLKPEIGIMFSLPLWGASRQVPPPAFDVYFLHSSEIGTAISTFPEKRKAESEWAQISCKSDIIQSRRRPLHILLVMIGLSSNIRTYLRSMSCPPRSTSQNITLR